MYGILTTDNNFVIKNISLQSMTTLGLFEFCNFFFNRFILGLIGILFFFNGNCKNIVVDSGYFIKHHKMYRTYISKDRQQRLPPKVL